MRRLLPLILCLWPAVASAGSYEVVPAQGGDVQVRYDHGAPVLISVGRRGVVQVAPVASRLDGRLRLSVIAYNRSGSPVNLGYENIAVTTDDGAPVRLYTYDRLRHEAHTKATWARIGLLLKAASDGYSDAYAGNTTVTGTAIGPGGVTLFTANAYSPGLASGASHADAEENREIADRIENRLDATMARLDSSILQTTTIDPGQAGGGEVDLEAPKLTKGVSRRIDVSVQFAGEVHTLAFYAAKDASLAPVAVATPVAASTVLSAPVAAPAPVASEPKGPADCTPEKIAYAQRVGIDCHALGASY
jgi:hypothetical protein